MAKSSIEFRIKGATPEDLSLDRLARYAELLHALLGGDQQVTLSRICKGSAVSVLAVPDPHLPKVIRHLQLVDAGQGHPKVLAAKEKINQTLAEHGWSGEISQRKGARIIQFPGVKTPLAQEARVYEHVELVATILKVGGKDNTIPVLLQTDEGDVRAQTTRAIAKDLGKRLFDVRVLVSGRGQWLRDRTGKWSLEELRIERFADAAPADAHLPIDLLEVLKATPGAGWDAFDDPQAELAQLRRG